MGILFTDNAASTLAAPITSTATSFSVAPNTGGIFPQPLSTADYFMATLEDPMQNPIAREIVQVTARTGDTFTVLRAQEGTTALAFNGGVTVAHRVTAGTMRTILASLTTTGAYYLGAFANAPTAQNNGTSLITGNLYYDTTQSQMFVYSGSAWTPVPAGSNTISYGLYLGAFPTAPLTMLNGQALVAGSVYYNTTSDKLFEWDGSAWDDASAQTTQVTNSSSSVAGNTVVDGSESVQGNLNVGGDITCHDLTATDKVSTPELYLGGLLVVDAGDVSGTPTSQNFPAGTVFQAGVGATDSTGTASVLFPASYKGGAPIVVATPVNAPVSCTLSLFSVTATGFSVGTAGSSKLNAVSTAFSWMAFGF